MTVKTENKTEAWIGMTHSVWLSLLYVAAKLENHNLGVGLIVDYDHLSPSKFSRDSTREMLSILPEDNDVGKMISISF